MSSIKWKCLRGLRELDTLLLTFYENSYPDLSAAEKDTFAKLLELDNQSLISLVLDKQAISENKQINAIVDKIKQIK